MSNTPRLQGDFMTSNDDDELPPMLGILHSPRSESPPRPHRGLKGRHPGGPVARTYEITSSRRSSHHLVSSSSAASLLSESFGVDPLRLDDDVNSVSWAVQRNSSLHSFAMNPSVSEGGATSPAAKGGPRASTRAQLRKWVKARQEKSKGGNTRRVVDSPTTASQTAAGSPVMASEPTPLLPSLRRHQLPPIDSTAQYVSALRESAMSKVRSQLLKKRGIRHTAADTTNDDGVEMSLTSHGTVTTQSATGVEDTQNIGSAEVDGGECRTEHPDTDSSLSGMSAAGPALLANTFIGIVGAERADNKDDSSSHSNRELQGDELSMWDPAHAKPRRGKPKGFDSLIGLRTICMLIMGAAWIAALVFTFTEVPAAHKEFSQPSHIKMLYHRAGSDALWIATSRLSCERLARLLRSMFLYEVTDFKDVSFLRVPTGEVPAELGLQAIPSSATLNPRRLHPAFLTNISSLSNQSTRDDWTRLLNTPSLYNYAVKAILSSSAPVQSLPSSSFGSQFRRDDISSITSMSLLFPANGNGVVWPVRDNTTMQDVFLLGPTLANGSSVATKYFLARVGTNTTGAHPNKCTMGFWGLEDPTGACFDMRAATPSTSATVPSLFAHDPMLRTICTSLNKPSEDLEYNVSSYIRSSELVDFGAWDVPRKLGYIAASSGKAPPSGQLFQRLYLPMTVPLPPQLSPSPNFAAANLSSVTAVLVLEFVTSHSVDQFFPTTQAESRTVEERIPRIPSLTNSRYFDDSRQRATTYLLAPSLLEATDANGDPIRRILSYSRTIERDAAGNLASLSDLNASLSSTTTWFPGGNLLQSRLPLASLNHMISASVSSAIRQSPQDGLNFAKFWATQGEGLSFLECPVLMIVTPLVSPNPSRYFYGLGTPYPFISNYTVNDPRVMWAAVTVYQCEDGQQTNYFMTDNFRLLISILAFLGVGVPLIVFVLLTLTVTTPLYKLTHVLSNYDSFKSVDAAAEAATTAGLLSVFYEVKKAQLVVVNALFQMESLLRVVELEGLGRTFTNPTITFSEGSPTSPTTTARPPLPRSLSDQNRRIASAAAAVDEVDYSYISEPNTVSPPLASASSPRAERASGPGYELRRLAANWCRVQHAGSNTSSGPSAQSGGDPSVAGRPGKEAGLSSMIAPVPGVCVVVSICGDTKFAKRTCSSQLRPPRLTGEAICRKCIELFGGIVGGSAASPIVNAQQRYVINSSFRSRDTCADPEGSAVAAAMLLDIALGSTETNCGRRAPGYASYAESVRQAEFGEGPLPDWDDALYSDAVRILRLLFSEDEFEELPVAAQQGARQFDCDRHIVTYVALLARDPIQVSVRGRNKASTSAEATNGARSFLEEDPMNMGSLVYSAGQHSSVLALTRRYHPLTTQMANEMHVSSSGTSVGRSLCMVVAGSDVTIGTPYTATVFDYVGLTCSRCSQEGKYINCPFCGGERSDHLLLGLAPNTHNFHVKESDFGTGVDGTILMQVFALKVQRLPSSAVLKTLRKTSSKPTQQELKRSLQQDMRLRRCLSDSSNQWISTLNRITMDMVFGRCDEAAEEAWALALSPVCVPTSPLPPFVRLSAWRLALQCEVKKAEKLSPAKDSSALAFPRRFGASVSVFGADPTIGHPLPLLQSGSILGSVGDTPSAPDHALSIFFPVPEPSVGRSEADPSLSQSGGMRSLVQLECPHPGDVPSGSASRMAPVILASQLASRSHNELLDPIYIGRGRKDGARRSNTKPPLSGVPNADPSLRSITNSQLSATFKATRPRSAASMDLRGASMTKTKDPDLGFGVGDM